MLQSAQMEIKLRFGDIERAAQASNRMADAQERTARATASASREQTTMLREAARGEASSRRLARRSISSAEKELGSYIGGYRRDAVTEGREADRTAARGGGGGGLGGFGARLVSRIPLGGGMGLRFGESLGALAGAGAPAAAAALGLGALALAAREAATTLGEVGKAGLLSGGTPGEIAGITSMGIPAGDIAGRAAAFRSRIHSDIFAQSQALRMGLGNYATTPRELGQADEAGPYQMALKYLDAVKKEKGPLEAVRQARIWGMEADLEFLPVSERVRRAMEEETKAREALYGSTTEAMQVQQLATIAQEKFNDAMVRLGREAIPFATAAIEKVNNALDRPAAAAGWSIPAMLLAAGNPTMALPLWWAAMGRGGGDPTDPTKDNAKATAANTAAVNNLTTVLQQGIVGGGPRAQSAFPANFNGAFAAHNAAAAARRWGAFSGF